MSIRRVHNKSDILLHQKSKFLGYMKFPKIFGPFVDGIAQNERNRAKPLMRQAFLCYYTEQ